MRNENEKFFQLATITNCVLKKIDIKVREEYHITSNYKILLNKSAILIMN